MASRRPCRKRPSWRGHAPCCSMSASSATTAAAWQVGAAGVAGWVWEWRSSPLVGRVNWPRCPRLYTAASSWTSVEPVLAADHASLSLLFCHVAASQLGEFLSRPEGAPTSVGRIAEADMADVPRFLNRCALAIVLALGWHDGMCSSERYAGLVTMSDAQHGWHATRHFRTRAHYWYRCCHLVEHGLHPQPHSICCARLSRHVFYCCSEHPAPCASPSPRLPTHAMQRAPCRLLGLDPEAQAILFDFYSAVLDALMDRARREGTLGERVCQGVLCTEQLLAPERHAAALCAAHRMAHLSCSCVQTRALWTSVRAAYRWRASRRCCCAMRPPVLPQVWYQCHAAHVCGVVCEMRHCWRRV